jgi:type I restriction enzyme S subunit
MTLGEVLTLQRGFDLPQKKRVQGTVPIISSSGTSDHHNESRVEGPGVVTGRYGTIGQVFYTEEPFWPLNTTLWVKDFKGNHPKFIYYLLHTINYLEYSDKAAVPGINRNHVHQAEVHLPPLETQKAIAHILGTLDDKIELNRRMNETLEAMAQALFKSWFVDFDPVKAKMEGRQPEGMDAETAALFPDKLVESELGLIPEGWEAKQLKKACSYLKRGLQPKYLDCGGVRVINQRCIRNHWIDYTNSRLHDSKIRKITGRELQLGDVVVNSTGVGTLGRVAQVYQLHQATIADTHITIMRPKNELLLAEYFGNWAIHNETKFESMGHGSTGQTELRRAELMELTLLVPSMKVQTAFNEVTSIFVKKRVENYNTRGTLTEARDILLPQLISGKLSVAEAEKQLESVL